MLIVIARARALPARRAELVSAANAVMVASRQEAGCQAYDFYADLTDENMIISLVVWRDQAALDAHMAYPHTQAFLAAALGLVEGIPTVAIHHVPDPH